MSPSLTRISCTMPLSFTCTVLACPDGTTVPSATATSFICPTKAQTTVITINAMTVQSTNRPVGDGGDSVTSKIAGRNSVSFSRSSPRVSQSTNFISVSPFDNPFKHQKTFDVTNFDQFPKKISIIIKF